MGIVVSVRLELSKMRCVFLFVALLALVASISALPIDDQIEESGSRTWTAIKNFFRPVGEWFTGELPKKTPSDLVDDAYETASDVKTWAQENPYFQVVGDAVKPVHTWVQGSVDSVKDQTFTDLYGGVKESVAQVDDSVGSWMEQNLG